MLTLGIHPPRSTAPPVDREWDRALDRARQEAGGVSGAFAVLPCRFYAVAPAAADLLPLRPPPVVREGTCVLATVRESEEPGHRAHLHERCLTAVQRFMLSLACDGVQSQWTEEGIPSADAFRKAGVGLSGEQPVGLIWCWPTP